MTEKFLQEEQRIGEIQSVFSVFDSIYDKDRETIYISHPITGGKRLIDALKRNQVESLETLNKLDPSFYFEQVLQANVIDGVSFGKKIRERNASAIVIIPGQLSIKEWNGEHYMALWESVIRKFVNNIYFNNHWQYSSGCVEEFLIGLQKGVNLREGSLRKNLDPRQAVAKVRLAIDELDNAGIDPTNLLNAYRSVQVELGPVRTYSMFS